jgi:hypothetical protein
MSPTLSPDEARIWLVDKYTRQYYEARRSVIHERSGSLRRDTLDMLRQVNHDRALVDLPPLEDGHYGEDDGYDDDY